MKNRKNRKKNIVLISIIFIGVLIYLQRKYNISEEIVIQLQETSQIDTSKLVIQDINYNESINKLTNPDRGFYHPATIYGTATGFDYSSVNSSIYDIKKNNQTLIHLRIDISKLSGRANGNQNQNLSEKDKSDINEAFDLIRQNNIKAIVRIAYDFDGVPNKEPDTLKAILEHIEQFKTIFETNKDVITVVETGFVGIWGEMHTSDYANNEDIGAIVNAILKSVPNSITVNVRTLDMYINLFGNNPIVDNIAYDGSDRSRVGIFNDGYLGSESDLGTYSNREEAINFLESHAKYTTFGGEAVAPDNEYNDIDYVQKEMFRTHTTYLNYVWNYEITQVKWGNTIYNGTNTVYKGQTAQKYIEDHLGYRFVLKESKISPNVKKEEQVEIVIKIENTGFGNVVNEKKVQLVLKNNYQSYIVDTNIDVRKWNSNQITTESIVFTIPHNMESGNWDLFIKITDKDNEQYTIQFANEEIWNTAIGANYIGSFSVIN